MAIPQILQQLNGSQMQNPMLGSLQNIKQLSNTINMLKSAKNPQALMQNMIQQNPQAQQAVKYVNENGGDPKAAFEKLAAERGIDPQMLRQQLGI